MMTLTVVASGYSPDSQIAFVLTTMLVAALAPPCFLRCVISKRFGLSSVLAIVILLAAVATSGVFYLRFMIQLPGGEWEMLTGSQETDVSWWVIIDLLYSLKHYALPVCIISSIVTVLWWCWKFRSGGTWTENQASKLARGVTEAI